MSHKEGCDCMTCFHAGLDAHLLTLGVDPRNYPKHGVSEPEPRRQGGGTATLTRPAVKLATPAQVKFLTSLLADKDTTGMDVPEDLDAVRALSIKAASVLIDKLMKRPYAQRAPKPKAERRPMVGPGLYRMDGQVYRVKIARQSGHCYAQRLDPESGRFDYDGGVILRLTEDMRMDVDEVEALSITYHMCMICSRELTNKDSIALGIGPICRSKY